MLCYSGGRGAWEKERESFSVAVHLKSLTEFEGHWPTTALQSSSGLCLSVLR